MAYHDGPALFRCAVYLWGAGEVYLRWVRPVHKAFAQVFEQVEPPADAAFLLACFRGLLLCSLLLVLAGALPLLLFMLLFSSGSLYRLSLNFAWNHLTNALHLLVLAMTGGCG